MSKATLFIFGLYLVFSDNDIQKELTKLEGSWDISSLEVEGKVQPKEKAPKQIVIAGEKLTGLGPDMTIVLDISKKPKSIDLIFKKGDIQHPIHAIYELNGDELRICMPVAQAGKQFDNKRPENFETKDKLVALIKAERAKKKK